MHDRQHAVEGEAAGRRHHVLLGDAALDESIRKLFAKRLDAAIGQQVGVEDDDLRPGPRHRQELVAVRQHDLLGLGGCDADRQRTAIERHLRLPQPAQPIVGAGQQFFSGREIVLHRRRAGMEVVGLVAAGQALHERHALALDGVGDEHLRSIGHGREMRERVA